MMQSALIIPTSTDRNKGDQALVWVTAEFVKKLRGIDEVILIAQDVHCPGSSDTKQSIALGYRFIEAFLKNPRRGIAAKENKIFDSTRNIFYLAINVAKDAIPSLWLLCWARYPSIANLLLPSELRNSYHELRRCKVVFVKGGGFIHAYKSLWWLYYLWYQLYTIYLAIRAGKRVIIMPNSFGPFESKFAKLLVKYILNRCTFISARESISAQVLEKLLEKSTPIYPDLGFFLIPLLSKSAKEHLMRLDIPLNQQECVGVTVRPWRFPGHLAPARAYKAYIQSMQYLVRNLVQRGYYPVFFPQAIGPSAHENDLIAIRDVTKGLNEVNFTIVNDRDHTCSDLMAFYGYMRCMIGTRFHSIIFATAMRVPCIAIAYGGNKGLGIMQDMGLSEYIVPIEEVTEELLIEKFGKLMANKPEILAKIDSYLNYAKKCALELVNEIEKLIIL